MFGSKTSKLLLELERCKYQNRKVAVFKPKMDDRYAMSKIVSHMGWSVEAVQVTQGSDILEHLSDSNEMYDVVAVDEMFMIPGSAEALVWLYQSGFNIIVSTLDLNYAAKPFREVEKVMPWATKVEKCPSVCTVCGRDAYYTHKKQIEPDEESTNVVVGGSELYEPRCYQHHVMVDKRPTT
jgi:thymidine kinase